LEKSDLMAALARTGEERRDVGDEGDGGREGGDLKFFEGKKRKKGNN
jgi:hypothetical protein